MILFFFCRFLEKGLGVNVTALATGKTETKIHAVYLLLRLGKLKNIDMLIISSSPQW